MARSSNTFTANRKNQSIVKRVKNHGWDGPNLSHGDPSEDLLYTNPALTTEGLVHFKNIQ